MAKQIVEKAEAQSKIRSGVAKVARTVGLTMGPRGRNVALQKPFGVPTITNDGVSIAKDITLSDLVENIGAEVVKEVAQKTNDKVGDGTTTSVVITGSLVENGLARTAVGVNAMGIKLGLEAARQAVVEELKASSLPIKDKGKIAQVATISAESAEIGKIIAETIDKVGKDGVVTVEESQAFGVESDIVEGLQFDKGFVSPYMVSSRERMEAVVHDASIFITDKKISSVQDVLPLLEKLAQSGKKEIVIIAEDIDGEALTTFVVNKLRGTFSVLGIKAPGYGDKKKQMLEDIAVVTGATVISDEIGKKVEEVTLADLGKATRVIATKDTTTIVGGKGKKQLIVDRAESLRKELAKTINKYEKEKLQERVAKLVGGVAVLRVGAPTESEMKYLKLKIEDAVNATKAAIEEGIVPGGGVALVKAAHTVRAKGVKSGTKQFSAEFQEGVAILLDACDAPLLKIVENADRKDSQLILEKVRNGGEGFGFDAAQNDFTNNMVTSGIIDPVKVTRLALENAVSAAGILLTTDSVVVEEPEPQKKEEEPMY